MIDLRVYRIVNSTPHPITLVLNERRVVEVPRSPYVARVPEGGMAGGDKDVMAQCGDDENPLTVPVAIEVVTLLPEIEGLPEEREGVYYIVSLPTAQVNALLPSPRGDLLITRDVIRDEAGRIIGCRGLAELL